MGSSKNVVLTVVICIAILLGWQVYNHYTQPKVPRVPRVGKQQQPGPGTAKKRPSPTKKQAGKTAGSGQARTAEDPAAAGPRSSTVEGKHTVLRHKKAVGTFTTHGGALRHWRLLHPRYKLVYKGKLEQMDLVATEKGRGPWPLSTVFFTDEGETGGINLPGNAEFTLTKQTARKLVYTYADKQVRVTKEYTMAAGGAVINYILKVKNLTEAELAQNFKVTLYNWKDPNLAKASMTNPYPRIPTITCHDGAEIQRRSLPSIRGEGSSCSAASCGMGEGEFISTTGQVWWIGAGDNYFITSVVPQDKKPGKKCELTLVEGKQNVFQASLYYPRFRLAAGKERSWKFVVYLGAKELGALDEVKGPTKDGDIGLSSSINFGWFFPLCRPMLWLLQKFHSVFGNWGIAIILLTLVVKLLTLYWTQKSMRSMKKMQHLKPQIDLLREKYPDDKNRLNSEMMSLYKVHKVNPLGGCLPMLIQMPIWFALFRTLSNSVELYRSPFFGWITDLTTPDPYYVLPIAMGIAMYGQQAITPQPMEGTQAKMMKYFMPGFFTFMMLFLPSGLTLYIFVNTVLTMLHQFYMNKTDPDKEMAAKIKESADKSLAAAKQQTSQGKPRGKKARSDREADLPPDHRDKKIKPRTKKRRTRKRKK